GVSAQDFFAVRHKPSDLAMITFNIVLGVGTRQLRWSFDKPSPMPRQHCLAIASRFAISGI
ncbi:MAG TPA: hypothetical protein VE400_11190, partial [Mycobacterium sp.]|nr:hypothetical protein [Mycobacterium sp.]